MLKFIRRSSASADVAPKGRNHGTTGFARGAPLLLLVPPILLGSFLLFVVGIGVAAEILNRSLRAEAARRVGSSYPPIEE